METLTEYQRPLRDLFSSLRERRILFVRPGGNWGDSLIYHGAQFLAHTVSAFRYHSVLWDRFVAAPAPPDQVIYLHGSGGFVRSASGRAALILRHALQTPEATVIQGPCTLADEHVLAELVPAIRAMRAERLVFFTRERTSAQIAARILPSSVEHHLNEDTALYSTRDVLEQRIGPARPQLDLIAVREDPEAADVPRVLERRQVVIDPARFAQSFDHWLRIHAASRQILTDRTHSAICGAILGIPTTMLAGAYHKNRSIWEFSLEQRGVVWLSDSQTVPTRPSVDPFLAWIPIALIRRSWRLDRMAKRLRGIPLS